MMIRMQILPCNRWCNACQFLSNLNGWFRKTTPVTVALSSTWQFVYGCYLDDLKIRTDSLKYSKFWIENRPSTLQALTPGPGRGGRHCLSHQSELWNVTATRKPNPSATFAISLCLLDKLAISNHKNELSTSVKTSSSRLQLDNK